MAGTHRTLTFVLVTCALLVAGAGWVAWGRGDRGIEPVHPAGIVPAADRSTLRGRIAYSTLAGDIWVMNADGIGRRRLTRSGAGNDFDPSWSPRARAIVFRTSRGHYVPDRAGRGAEGIFVVDVRTKRQREIEPRTGGLFPDWSPNGALIAFSGLRGRTGDSVHVMTPRGRHVRDLGGSGAGECAEWSPDGERIAYCGHDGDGNWATWVMNRDGSERRQLTHPVPSSPPGSGGDYPGAWSPDGSQIVYTSRQQGDFDLFLMKGDGTDRRRLTNWPGGDGASAWLPSGQIVFSHFTGNQRLPRWYLVNPDGSGLRSLPWLHGAGDPLDWIQVP